MPEPHRIAGTVITNVINGGEVRFFVQNPRDEIQSFHYAGRFFEQGILEALQTVFRPGGVFLDVGANVGNHTLYAEIFMRAGEIIPIEPNPDAIAILRTNVALNGLRRTNLQHVGVALSDEEAGHDITVTPNNMGWAMLTKSAAGTIRSVTGDSLFAERTIDFIKMDVEGMELAALRGLQRTIDRNRPSIFIEVDVENRAGFSEWLRDKAYQVAAYENPRPKNQNFLLEPVENAARPGLTIAW